MESHHRYINLQSKKFVMNSAVEVSHISFLFFSTTHQEEWLFVVKIKSRAPLIYKFNKKFKAQSSGILWLEIGLLHPRYRSHSTRQLIPDVFAILLTAPYTWNVDSIMSKWVSLTCAVHSIYYCSWSWWMYYYNEKPIDVINDLLLNCLFYCVTKTPDCLIHTRENSF